ncbi:DNA repair exonuclease [Tumidithrix elongata RA019]|uniref:Nuclease SbcCD subunit D n=1 Tax=Tumidithrix elongata BACA0141 TaxID=2716417 RepID=A0AAW9PVW3_9CYAN|nr:DNA repair exonuclease [Tumidithrix elongata RA019]
MKLVHLADLHLGFRAYNRLTTQGVNRREADVFRAFQEALQKTAELKPDVVLIAGDVFHVPRPGNLAVVQTQKELIKFQEGCGAEIVVIAGNHESVKSSDNRCILELMSLIPRVQVITNQPEAVEVCDGQAKVFCLPHNALGQVEQIQIRPDPDYAYNLLMLHGTVDSDRINDYGGYEIPTDLLALPWDYVACGHYHSYTPLGRNAYYAGAIERTSNDIWKEAKEDKGFVSFDLTSHKAQFHKLESPRKTVDLPIIDATGKDAPTLDQIIADQANQVGIEDKLVRQKVINLPKSVQRQLDYKQLRTFQMMAVHYLFEPRSPEVSTHDSNGEGATRQGGLADKAQEFLQNRELSAGIDRDRLVAKGLAYLNPSQE